MVYRRQNQMNRLLLVVLGAVGEDCTNIQSHLIQTILV